MKALLALDLGTKLGFRVGNAASSISGTINLAPKSSESWGMRYVKLRGWLNEIGRAYDVDHVSYEIVHRHKGTAAAHIYGGLQAVVMDWCIEKGIDYDGIEVGDIKRHWTGKGNASKEQMIAASVEKGLSPSDDNEADAQALFDLKFSGQAR